MRLDTLSEQAIYLAGHHPFASVLIAFAAGVLSWVATQARSGP
jgi:hypothetical protein